MTIGVAVRLANILKLHLNNPGTVGVYRVHGGLPPSTDPLKTEMRRRSFWALYICETYDNCRTGMPPLLEEDRITVPLRCPGLLDRTFTPTPMPTLADSYSITNPSQCQLSEFASLVLLSALNRRCYHHAELSCRHKDSAKTAKDFWTRHFSLQTLIEDRERLLAPNMTVQAVKTHPVSISSYVFLRGIDIYLHEAALVKVDQEGEEPGTITAAEIKQ
ncbi:hypothetical protein BDV19DRAFT_360637 [Aspergillus venezuelensis]